MSPSPPARNGVNGGRRSATGSVLRDVVIDPVPLMLQRPGARPHAAAQPVASPASAAERAAATRSSASTGCAPAAQEPPSHPAQPVRGYDEGFQAGFAAGEAAERGRLQTAVQGERRAAFEQGLQEGRQQGLAEGREAARQAAEHQTRTSQEATAARLAQVDGLLASLPAELARRLHEAEDDMVALCHAAICRVLGEELATAQGMAQQVRQAVREYGPTAFGNGHGQLALHMRPDDLAAMERDPELGAWLRQHASSGAVQWVADEHVRMGGCLVRSAEGTLDARLETQLGALQRLLLEQRGGSPSPAPADPGREEAGQP